MQLNDYLKAERGRMAAVAVKAGIAPAFLSQIASGVRGAPAERAADLERACDFLVRRWDLRPDDWHRIWPELIGTEGAPDVPANEIPEGRGSQHVVKAEGDGPDATDRETPAMPSPVGGPMGTEQPAAAGLAGVERRHQADAEPGTRDAADHALWPLQAERRVAPREVRDAV